MWLRTPWNTIPCIQSWRYPLDGLRSPNPAKQALAKRPLGVVWESTSLLPSFHHRFGFCLLPFLPTSSKNQVFLGLCISWAGWTKCIWSWSLNHLHCYIIFIGRLQVEDVFCTVGMFDCHCLVCWAMFVSLPLHPSNGSLGSKRVWYFWSWLLKKMPFNGDPCSSVHYSFQEHSYALTDSCLLFHWLHCCEQPSKWTNASHH